MTNEIRNNTVQDTVNAATAAVKVLPVRNKSMATFVSQSFEDFLATAPALEGAIRRRLLEIRISPADQDFFVYYPDVLNFFLLLSEESPETVVVAPILVRLAQCSPRFTLSVLRDSDDLTSLDRIVDELDLVSALSEIELPLLLVFDEEWNFQCSWSGHPQQADRNLEEWFARHPEYDLLAESDAPADEAQFGVLLEKLTHEMRVWYNSGLNEACIAEVRALLAALLEDDTAEDEDDV